MVSGFRDTREDAGGQAIGEAIFQGAGEVVEEDKTSVIVISRLLEGQPQGHVITH